jgi:hypothetical protein
MLSRLKTALRALLHRSQAELELDEELRYHIGQQTEQNIRLGMDPEEARHATLRGFGGVEQTKERSRDAREVTGAEVARGCVKTVPPAFFSLAPPFTAGYRTDRIASPIHRASRAA